MFIIIMLAALCCCLCLCIAQVNRLPYRDFAQSNVVSLVLDFEQPNQRGPPSTSGRVLEYPTCSMLHPVSVAVGVNRDGGRAPDGSLEPQGLKAFAPRTNVRELYRLRRLARFALSFPKNDTTVPAGSAGSLFRRNRPANGMSSSLHSSTIRN